MAKRKVKKKTSSTANNILTYTAWGLATVALALSSLVGGYYIGYEDAQKDMQNLKKAKVVKKLPKLKKEDLNTQLKNVLKKESKVAKKKYAGSSHEYGKTIPKAPKRVKKDTFNKSSKPKLAIIIDDVGVRSHVEAIKSLGIPITMAFLPPSSARPNSAKLAAKERFYMVHLPLEAQNFSAEEPNTLRVGNSSSKVRKRIREIKRLFPDVKYINNHTGSKFTSNQRAMKRLIDTLESQNIEFIDSRTTAKTKVPTIMKNLGKKYVARDVFLDHVMTKKYVKKAIKNAIRIAKEHGSAIAIGHPHKNTIIALHESKHLFKDVELIFVDKLYK